ncbi:uncharacterized protein LOC129036797 isoform X2 [Pongo pygmaeus]|uniref:uncharacterized protein LOC129036797 isoform X2 n=1 Tax=Pongo pygmaeus TaxID=9600 RepID=UPI0023E18791|nr:uncharacterized protein LOC129036797 isoform X2 [Pongo pygmaeus]XP_054344377.1 uncharacterized protein LOC129036797 isoform X2 [Pongo pygmaeus]
MSQCGATADPKTGCRKWCSLETMSQKNCEAESGAPTSPSLLEEDDSGPLSSQQQAISSRDKKPLSSLHLSHRTQVALEYLPFFCTYGCLLADEGLVLQLETPLQDDSELLSGFFPYYHSEEESLPSLALPGWSHRGSQDLPTEKEAQAGCFCRTTVRNECSAALAHSDLISGSSHSLACCPVLQVLAGFHHDSDWDAPLSRDDGLYASGFVNYYRTPEDGLHTSPGPPASPSGSQGPSGAAQGWCSHTKGKLELTAAETTGEQAPSTH